MHYPSNYSQRSICLGKKDGLLQTVNSNRAYTMVYAQTRICLREEKYKMILDVDKIQMNHLALARLDFVILSCEIISRFLCSYKTRNN